MSGEVNTGQEAGHKTGPGAPPEEGSALPGLAGQIDDAIFSFEKAFVTAAALVMTSTMTLGIVYRAFAVPDSQIGKIIAGIISDKPDEALMTTLNTQVVPILLALVAFGCGWGGFVARRRRDNLPRPVPMGLMWGAITLGVAWGFTEFVVAVPSRWVCLVVLEGGMLTWAAYAAKRQQWVAVGLALIFGVLGGWGTTVLPVGYTWGEELSLILLAWVAFLGASMATRTQRHIVVDALSRVLPKGLGGYARATGMLVTCLFSAYLAILAAHQIFGSRGDLASGEIRPATGLPAWTITASIMVAFGLMSLRFLAFAIDGFIHPRVPERQVTH